MRMVRLLKSIKMFLTTQKSNSRYIFVTGVPRSGTTLLKATIESHSSTCGSPHEGSGIIIVDDIYKRDWSQVGIERDIADKIFQSSKNIISFYDRVANKICNREGAKFFVDKMPFPPGYHRLLYSIWKFEKAVFFT
ncbi:hypothetical protein GGP66_000207 [Salinibacter ruber]|uniref:sulfotransferase n=1 Tax=Salinibacter ruber TaxID=146919 RepID=UPI002169F5F3|nr:sulfotransferase [Salinibacter ruber]MCS3672803.1 hypothetical protein [Salinibacter ruber]